MELTQLVQRAQEALDRGEFHVVEAACRHALATYPTCLSAHRLLGEACLEQGRIEEAVERFGLALVLDPLDVVSYLGLGVAAEERGDLAAAHGHYLRAWELNPSLERLRDEMIRLQEAMHGSGQLQRTRAALASLYARTGQLSRAVAEWRAVLAAEPTSVPARTALIEVLWRQGDDGAALALCREVLAEAPETAHVLAILADLEQRRALPSASTTAATYRSLDPSGDVLVGLLAVKPQANLGWLLPEPAMVPPFDFDAASRIAAPVAAPVHAEPVPVAVPEAPATAGPAAADQSGPAPDLWDSLVRDLGDGAGEAGDLAPFDWPADDPAAGFDLDDLADAAPIGTTSLEDRPLDEALVEAVVGIETAPAPDPGAGDSRSAPGSGGPGLPPAPGPDPFITEDGRVDLTVGWDDLDRTLAAATPSGDVDGFDELIAAVGAEGVAPFDPLADDGEAWEPFDEDDFSDWEETPVPPQAVAEDIAADASAVPEPPLAADDHAPAGGTGDDVLWPDDPTAVDAVAMASEPPPASGTEALFNAADAVAAIAAVDEADVPEPPALAELDAVQALTVGWDAIEEELAAAKPPADGQPVIDGLESIDDEGLVPFDFAGVADAIDPLANPDAVGAPLDFDDLLLVTSRDGTAPLGGGLAAEAPDWSDQDEPGQAVPFDPAAAGAAAADGVASAQANQAPGAIDGIEPFAFDDLAPVPADEAIDFSDVEGAAAPTGGAADDFGFFDGSAVAALSDAAPADEAVAWEVGSWSPERAEVEESTGAAAAEAIEVAADGAATGIEAAAPVAALAADAPESAGEDFGVVAAAEDGAVAEATAPAAARPSAWPGFVSGTSDLLVDRHGEVGTIFARLRDEKSSLVGLGLLQLDRSLTRPPVAAGDAAVAVPLGANGHSVPDGAGEANGHGGGGTAELAVATAATAAPAAENGERDRERPVAAVSPDLRAEVAGWRERLRLDPAAADEVASTIERRIADAGPEPLLLRVLGEAYVRLGRSDLAATRFRAAAMGRLRRL